MQRKSYFLERENRYVQREVSRMSGSVVDFDSQLKMETVRETCK